MNILVVSQYFYPENFRINDLCYGLKEKGNKVTVLTAKPNYPSGSFFHGYSFFGKNDEKIKGIDVYRAKVIPRGSANGLRLFINYISFVFFGCFKLLKVRGNYDKVLVFAPSPITVGFVGIFASMKFRCKSFLWVHDLWPESVKYAGGIKNSFIIKLVDLMTRMIYSNFNFILVQSPDFENYLIKQNVPKNKIIYYPYYAEDYYRVTKENEDIKLIFPDGLNIVFAGNIGVAQSFDTIIDAVKIVSKKIKKITIIIIGDGRDRTRVQKKINDENLQDYFIFLGSHPPEKMSFYFASADALLVTLRKSLIFSLTIPSKIQSYLACGKPIIGAIDGIGSKIIKNSNSGYTGNSEDFKELAKNILKFNNLNNEEKVNLGANARKYFENEFNRDKLLDRLLQILIK